MIATTIEQSRKLIELGLDPKTADMSYSEEYFGKDNDGNDEWCWRLNACRFIDVEGIIPAWSLSALLEVMPKYITDNGVEYKIEIWTDGLAAPKWVIGYSGKSYSGHHLIQRIITIIHRTIGDDLLTAAYEMVCYLLRNNLIEKGGVR